MHYQEIVMSLALAAIIWQLKVSASLKGKIDALHRWHEPDQQGRQSWKDTGPILMQIGKTHELLNRLCDLMERRLERLEEKD